MAFRADCQQDRSASVRGAGGTLDCLASTYRPVEVKPTAIEHTAEVTDTNAAEVSQPQVASTPPAPIQLSAPPNVVGTVPEIPEAANRGWFLFPYLQSMKLLKQLQSVLRSVSGGTLRECARHQRDLISERFFCFLVFPVFLRN